MKKTKENAITLVALVITIVILLILAGIAISNLLGEHGLINQAKLGKEKYAISAAKEKLELEITNLQVEQESKGESLTKEILPKINNDDIDVRDISNFPVEVICGKYKFEVDNNFQVKYIGEADDTVIKYTTEPDNYTNQNSVKVMLKISNPKGIKSIEKPGEESEIVENQTKIETDFTVDKNGHYILKVVDVEDKEVTKDIYIDLIDTLAPKEFTPEIQKNEKSITVVENGNDAEATEESSKSGIDHYEYYIIDSSNKETKYETNIIENLELGTYKLYVIAFDRAGNSTKSKVIDLKISIQFKKIVVGTFHTLALDNDNNLWAWGYNKEGQLGDGTTTDRTVPVQIKQGIKFMQISAGGKHSLAIDSEGKLWSWGYNFYGELGDGTTENKLEPIQVMKDTNFKEIFAGGLNSFAIDNSGNVWACGYNAIGQLGDGTKENKNEFIKVFENMNIKEISCDGYSTLLLDKEGNLWVCGMNSSGQLGDGTIIDRLTPVQIKHGTIFSQISIGGQHSLALDSEGNLWSWGFNRYGTVGDGTAKPEGGNNCYKNIPVQIKQGTKFKQISAGEDHCLAIDNDNNLWAWGRNLCGNIGDGTKNNAYTPIQIKTENKLKSVFAAYRWSLAIDEKSNLLMWGECAGFNSLKPKQLDF